MKLKIVALALMLVVALGACAGKKDWAGDPELIHKLAIKMPAAEIKQMLGEPSDTMRMEAMGIVTETWTYNGSKKVQLIVQDGKLVAAHLDGKMIMEAAVGDL